MRQDVVTSLPDLLNRVDVGLWGVADIFRRTRWSAMPGSETVLGVSKHGINKEFDVLVRALALLRDRFPTLRLTLTGTPEESRWSRRSVAIADRLGVSESVCFAGDVPNPRIPELIQASRLLVFPTWCESFGLPLAEALAMGAPAVAADIPACREVGGDAATYYAPGDAQSLATAIADILASPARAAALSAAALIQGQQFTWRANAEAVRHTLAHAMAGRS
jgi:glycosyltransferase involved in cell wall biosynthesis